MRTLLQPQAEGGEEQGMKHSTFARRRLAQAKEMP